MSDYCPIPRISSISVTAFHPAKLDGAVSGGSFDHVQMVHGVFCGELMHAQVGPDGRFDYGAYNLPLLAFGEIARDRVVLGLVGSDAGKGRLNGSRVEHASLVVIPEAGELHYQMAPGSRWAALQVARTTLERAGLERRPTTVALPVLQPAHRHELWRLVIGALSTLAAIERHAPEILDPALAGRAVIESLTAAFVSGLGLTSPRRSPERCTGARHFELARRARDFIAADLSAPIRIAELCSDVGASFRTLERAFASSYGVTPKEFLTLLRLARARRLLRTSGAGATTVAAVAMECGYYHLGRFSQHYFAQYGEPPSATLRYSRGHE